MHPVLWLGVILLLLGGAGALWKGLRGGPVHPLKRPEVQVGVVGVLAGSAKIVEAYWSVAAGIALMMGAAAVSVVLLVRLWEGPSERGGA